MFINTRGFIKPRAIILKSIITCRCLCPREPWWSPLILTYTIKLAKLLTRGAFSWNYVNELINVYQSRIEMWNLNAGFYSNQNGRIDRRRLNPHMRSWYVLFVFTINVDRSIKFSSRIDFFNFFVDRLNFNQ